MESGRAGVLPRLTAPQLPAFQHLHDAQHQHKHRSLSLLGPSTSPRENRRDLRCKHQRTRIHLRGETETSRIEKYGTAVKRSNPKMVEGM